MVKRRRFFPDNKFEAAFEHLLTPEDAEALVDAVRQAIRQRPDRPPAAQFEVEEIPSECGQVKRRD